MPSLHHLVRHIRQYGVSHTPLYLVAFAVFFFMVFDGILAYLVPLLITERGFSLSAMGWIIGSSSIAGALFDFLLIQSKIQIRFRQFFLVAFLMAALYAAILFHAYSVGFFLLAMALWGVYWDLYVFGSFDFVGRHTAKKEHTSSFGVLLAFAGLGGLLAPLIAEQSFESGVQSSFFAAAVALGCALIIFLGIILFLRNKKPFVPLPEKRKKHLFSELRLLKRLGFLLFPPILLTFFLHAMNGLFWTLAPLYPFINGGGENALFLIAYELPALFVGWFVGSCTARFGKKRVAFLSLCCGSLLLVFLFLFSSPVFVIGGVFLSSLFLSSAFPAINGAYADYISEAPALEEDIEGVQDMCANSGYIIGPICAGILAESVGIPLTFALFGAVGVVVGGFLFITVRKPITISTKKMI